MADVEQTLKDQKKLEEKNSTLFVKMVKHMEETNKAAAENAEANKEAKDIEEEKLTLAKTAFEYTKNSAIKGAKLAALRAKEATADVANFAKDKYEGVKAQVKNITEGILTILKVVALGIVTFFTVKLIPIFLEAFDDIKKGKWKEAMALLSDSWATIGITVGLLALALWKVIKLALLPLKFLRGTLRLFGLLPKAVAAEAAAVKDAVKKPGFIKRFFKLLWRLITKPFRILIGLFNKTRISYYLLLIGKIIKRQLKLLPGRIGGFFQAIGFRIGAFFSSLGTTIATFFKAQGPRLLQFIKTRGLALGRFLLSGIGNFLRVAVMGIIAFFSGIPGMIVAGIAAVIAVLASGFLFYIRKQTGITNVKDLAMIAWGHIKDALNFVGNLFKRFGNFLKEKAASFLGIAASIAPASLAPALKRGVDSLDESVITKSNYANEAIGKALQNKATRTAEKLAKDKADRIKEAQELKDKAAADLEDLKQGGFFSNIFSNFTDNSSNKGATTVHNAAPVAQKPNNNYEEYTFNKLFT